MRYGRYVRHKASLRRRLKVGRDVSFGPGAVLLPPDMLRIGDRVSIGRGFHVEANVVIGDDVLISSQVAIVGNDHAFGVRELSIYWAGRLPPATVVLEGDNLLGFGSVIVGSVRIGKGCVVGAGSVVTRDLPADTVCVGIPARPIRARYDGEDGNTRPRTGHSTSGGERQCASR